MRIVSWIIKLCALCSMSALMQMMVSGDASRDSIRMICGLLMLHMTMDSAQALAAELAAGADLNELFALLLK